MIVNYATVIKQKKGLTEEDPNKKLQSLIHIIISQANFNPYYSAIIIF